MREERCRLAYGLIVAQRRVTGGSTGRTCMATIKGGNAAARDASMVTLRVRKEWSFNKNTICRYIEWDVPASGWYDP
jgi:hypothetical protein